jgi:hypothetical protein
MATATTTVTIFVDLQGFLVGERFIAKEVAVLRNETRELTHHVFCAPMEWDLLTSAEKAKASSQIANHHGLRWEDGDVDYRLAKTIIRRAVCDNLTSEIWQRGETPDARIYVQGIERKRWLEDLLGYAICDIDATIETIDVEYGEIGQLECLRVDRAFRCGRHQRCCALENVMKLRNWWNERRERLSDIDAPD